MKIKTGIGIDVHRLEAGREFWLGGIKIGHEKGCVAHSDGDVLIHAICDALLGATGLGDIGQHFPDTDPRYKGADSVQLLHEVGLILAAHGYSIENIDSTIIAQRPKLMRYLPEMRANVAKALNLSVDQVSIKATTEEHLGFTGRGEGISAQAVALLI